MELSERKKQILKAIIGDYIRTAEPVGSKTLTARPELKFSSATIRNEMSELEEMGFLEKPHTSAGRIPSPAGYRLYVDDARPELKFSSATIRNEMSELEEMGFLEKPHTSAGRIPSPAGYRLYVDELMGACEPPEGDEDALNQMRGKVRELDRLVQEAGRLVSTLTNYASVAVQLCIGRGDPLHEPHHAQTV